jgi:putative heme iron utilization protein
MAVDNPKGSSGSATPDVASAARSLLRTALKGALGTLHHESGHPFVSLVLVATEPDGSPIFLISKLAVHTQNLARDSRASLLIDGTAGLGDPLTGGRLTLSGHARPTASPTAKPRFVARHTAARGYAGFPDFSMYALDIAAGHYVGGFGTIVSLTPADLLSSTGAAGDLIAAEMDILEHMNSDHTDAVALYATELAGSAPGAWRMSGVDPDGFDLLHCSMAARVAFPSRVSTPDEARRALVALVKQARARHASSPH